MATFLTHDLGERFLARSRFAPLGSTSVASPDATDQVYLQVLEADCLYDDAGHADGAKCLHTVAGADAPFATVVALDHLYLVGGPGATTVTPGCYHVASVGGDNENVLLSASPYAGDVAGGIVVLRSWRFCLALDARTEIHETDTIATMAAAEEDGTDYVRKLVDPMDSASWTIDQDTDSGDYQGTSVQVTWTSGGVNWQTNRNVSLIAFTGLLPLTGTTTNHVLIASYQLDTPVVALTTGQTWGVQFRMRFGEGV